ncbi:hypothetical protein K443DRAFT_672811 [Laccaria amethystina LaAM-08-1]|uniref:AN1-type domain-containing protein n=1 Tax=Laccaria amethystina LaAM-08-1 TaxID=1095629 RepID=A0A0C9YC97_9AGAR|nr:hypothetical protein K443DRAFT_672811 [Laccaria amethystina LaAM-08-1]
MSSSTLPESDSQLLEIGKQCSHQSCLLVDFLPFKCQHCELAFCQEHFKVEAHQCPKYDEGKHNRVAPNCPMCNIPVAVRPGQDPNVRMELHLNQECSMMSAKQEKSKATPRCARGTCKKVLFSPIRCVKCREQFCPAHRFPADHNCANSIAQARQTPSRPAPNFSAAAKTFNSKASATGSAAVDAVKKSVASINTSAAATNSGLALPFNKTDRLSPSAPSMPTNELDDTTNNSTTANPTSNVDASKSMPWTSIIPRPICTPA